MFSMFFRKDEAREAALELYNDIVAQSRLPVFYEVLGIADTPEGRFDMITLHVFLVLRRLNQEPDISAKFSQKLFDIMFQNMDHSLREMGVGDLSVGKKVRGLAEVFYGRAGAYETALDSGDDDQIRAALARNIFDNDDVAKANVDTMTAYVMAAITRLENQPLGRIMLGIVQFPDKPL